MSRYVVTSLEGGVLKQRVYVADDADHAREQHDECLPEEAFVSVRKITCQTRRSR